MTLPTSLPKRKTNDAQKKPMNGKGSKPRPYSPAKFRDGYDRIFSRGRCRVADDRATPNDSNNPTGRSESKGGQGICQTGRPILPE